MSQVADVAMRCAGPASGKAAIGDDLSLRAAAAQAGDEAARDRLLAEIRPLVVRYCWARMGHVANARCAVEDVAQEVCLAILRALPRYRDTGRPFLAFVFAIAARKVADERCRAARSATPVACLPERPDIAAGPEEYSLRAEDARLVRELLERLPATHRRLLVLREISGLSARDTGKVIGMSPGSVRVAQHRVLGRLRVLAHHAAG